MTDTPPIDAQWLERMRSRPDFLRALYGAFLADEPRRLAALSAAVQAGDTAQLRYLAHSLKGAAATLGLRPLSDACRELEFAARDQRPEAFPALLSVIAARLDEVFAAMRPLVQD